MGLANMRRNGVRNHSDAVHEPALVEGISSDEYPSSYRGVASTPDGRAAPAVVRSGLGPKTAVAAAVRRFQEIKDLHRPHPPAEMTIITDEERRAGQIYVARGRTRPEGWALAHNHIRHGKNARNSIRGFRYFWLKSHEGWSVCHCGWRPELGVHYSKHPNAKILPPRNEVTNHLDRDTARMSLQATAAALWCFMDRVRRDAVRDMSPGAASNEPLQRAYERCLLGLSDSERTELQRLIEKMSQNIT
jgi:hypothetical protein